MSPCTPLRALAGSAGAVTVREASAPGASAIGAWWATWFAAPSEVLISTRVTVPSPIRSAAVVGGRIIAVASCCSRSTEPSIPITVYAWPFRKTAGAFSTELMPRSSAAWSPRTTTRSCRAMSPSSKKRPATIPPRTAAGSVGDAATTAMVWPLTSPGATTSLARTSTLAVAWESASAATDSTPASRLHRVHIRPVHQRAGSGLRHGGHPHRDRGGGQGVEPAHDLIARSGRDPDGDDQGGDAQNGAERGQG